MLYLQYELHNSWGQPYKCAPHGVKYPNFVPNMAPNINIMVKSSQFESYTQVLTKNNHKNAFLLCQLQNDWGCLLLDTPGGKKTQI